MVGKGENKSDANNDDFMRENIKSSKMLFWNTKMIHLFVYSKAHEAARTSPKAPKQRGIRISKISKSHTVNWESGISYFRNISLSFSRLSIVTCSIVDET